MFDVLRFWLGRGVDGFRVDVIWCLIKDDQFRDNPPNPDWRPGQSSRNRLLATYECDRPEVHDLIAQMRKVLDGYGDRLLIGEIYLPVEKLVTYYGKDGRGAQMPFNFTLIKARWTAAGIADTVTRYEAALPLGAWPNWVLSNHDLSRVATRIGAAQARVAAMLLLTLRGTPTIYYGEEIGMRDTPIPPELVQDPAEKNQPGIGQGRDPERTPDAVGRLAEGRLHHGHAVAASGRARRNQRGERGRPTRVPPWRCTGRCCALRRERPELVGGATTGVAVQGDVLRYTRGEGTRRIAVALNLGAAPQEGRARTRPRPPFDARRPLRPVRLVTGAAPERGGRDRNGRALSPTSAGFTDSRRTPGPSPSSRGRPSRWSTERRPA